MALAWALGAFDRPQPIDAAPAKVATKHSPQDAEALAGTAAASAATAAAPPRATSVAELLSTTSLAGTEIDGDWGIDANGQLRPHRALRQRLDYFLSLKGELPLEEVIALVERELQQGAGDAAARQIRAVWDAYITLQQHPWQQRLDPADPTTWSAALAEQMQARRKALGPAMAAAFYGAEEDAMRARIGRASSMPEGGRAAAAAALNATGGIAPPWPAPALLPDAPQRQAALEMEHSAWDARVAVAREQLARIQRAPELSEPQRAQAVQSMLNEQFTHNTDRMRAGATLGL